MLGSSAGEAAQAFVQAGGRVITPPFGIPVGLVADALGNVLVLVDLSAGRYTTDNGGSVTGVHPA